LQEHFVGVWCGLVWHLTLVRGDFAAISTRLLKFEVAFGKGLVGFLPAASTAQRVQKHKNID
jgi:hypothetical protein